MKLLKNPPTIGQFTLDGMWENALSFRAHQPPSVDEIKEYLANRNELAFELFFGDLFFGVRFLGTPDFIMEFSRHCIRCLNTSLDASSFIKAIGNHVLCGDLCREVTYMEVGAVNAWKSIGSYRLPPLTLEMESIDELWGEICSTHLANESKHPKAIELVYSDPLPHWIGYPVSTQLPPYDLKKDLFLAVVQHYCQQGKAIDPIIIDTTLE